jgi:stage IV sporulation protein FB
MSGSIRLLTIAGIDVRMHMTFPLILVWSALQFGVLLRLGVQGAAFGVLVTLILFAIVLLHELGHSFAALYYGIPVKRIVLLPIGGVAELARLPNRPSQELVVALAGPAVNVVLAVVLFAIALVTPLGASIDQGRFMSVFSRGALANPGEAIFQYVFAANLGLLLFNLVPAFPLDGGRVLRALLAMPLGQTRATRIAVLIGQAMAVLLGIYGLLSGNFLLIILAIFIFTAGSQEGRAVRALSVLAGIRVHQVPLRQVAVARPFESMSQVLAVRFQTFQSDFPVLDGDKVVGLLTSDLLDAALRSNPEWTPVRQVMRTSFPVAQLDDLITDVQQRMADTEVPVAPVLNAEGAFVGMLTLRDIAEAYQILATRQQAMEAPGGQRATRP